MKHAWNPQWAAGRIVDRRQTDRYDIFIGRPSKWGNPISGCRRELALRAYEVYLRRRPDLLAALPELAGKVLACYCHPLPCHGEVLLKLLWEFHGLR